MKHHLMAVLCAQLNTTTMSNAKRLITVRRCTTAIMLTVALALFMACPLLSHAQKISLKSPDELFKQFTIGLGLKDKIPREGKEYKRVIKQFERFDGAKKQKKNRIAGKLDKHLPPVIQHMDVEAAVLLGQIGSSDLKVSLKARKGIIALRKRLLAVSNHLLTSPELVRQSKLITNYTGRLKNLELTIIHTLYFHLNTDSHEND